MPGTGLTDIDWAISTNTLKKPVATTASSGGGTAKKKKSDAGLDPDWALKNLLLQYSGVDTTAGTSQLPGTTATVQNDLFGAGGLLDAFSNSKLSIGGYANIGGKWYTQADIDKVATSMGGTKSGGGGWSFSGGGGGTAKASPVKWSNMYTVENAPSWWQGLVPSAYNAETSYLALINSLIPTMSPEDQKSTATYLATAFPDAFGIYNPETNKSFTEAPENITSGISHFFQSTERANQALAALDKLVSTASTQTGKKTADTEKALGSGYKFLRTLVNTLKDYGGKSATEQQTRRQYLNQAGQLDPLLALGKSGDLAPYAPIAQKIAQPYFTAGQITPLVNGKFGKPNKQLFG